MSVVLRSYQRDIQQKIISAWDAGKRVVMPVLPTGAGKTRIMGATAKTLSVGHGIAGAHRSELVGQISMALAEEGIEHDIMVPKKVIKTIVEQHQDELGRMFYNARSRWHVVGVDTLIRRDVSSWASHVTMGFMDEGHHVLRENKWGRGLQLFPNAKWMLPTATPCRADGKGLGSHASGLVDELVVGPTMRWMIDNGYLTDCVVRAPQPSDLDLSDVDIVNGEFNKDQARAAVKRSSKIIGDVVGLYARETAGKLGIVFAVDVEHAGQLSQAFNAAGFPAAVITADNSTEERREMLKAFKRGDLRVLVNVDLFGEGFDLPAVEVVMFARPTASFSLYAQQWGRGLRLMISRVLMTAWDTYDAATRKKLIAESAKPYAHIHDHVGNLHRFCGPPWMRHDWSLDDVTRANRGGSGIPTRTCLNVMCLQPYPRTEPQCPFCGQVPAPPEAPSRPEEVDGDLMLYTKEMLDEMFGDLSKVLGPNPIHGKPRDAVQGAIYNNHENRKAASQAINQLITFLRGAPGLNQQRFNRQFFYRYGVDTLRAQAMSAKEMLELRQKIVDDLQSGAVSSFSPNQPVWSEQ